MQTGEFTRWEYETVRPDRESTKKEASDPKATLNELGAEGWELIETITYESGGTKYLVFKRPRPVESAE
jgi:hypothetical protein